MGQETNIECLGKEKGRIYLSLATFGKFSLLPSNSVDETWSWKRMHQRDWNQIEF